MGRGGRGAGESGRGARRLSRWRCTARPAQGCSYRVAYNRRPTASAQATQRPAGTAWGRRAL